MTSAIIVAAGRGTRMGPGKDKLFLEVAGRPVVAHTWEHFDRAGCIDEIVLVVRAGLEGAFRELAEQYHFQKPYRVVRGGDERQESVWNGLEAVSSGADLVAIQDGARPCVGVELILATVKAAGEVGAAVAAQPVTDTVKQSEDGQWIDQHLDRSRIWSVQTPQSFRLEVIRRALAAVRAKGIVVTDDTAACELIGQRVRLVVGLGPNPKVTVPGDLPYIESVLRGLRGPGH